MAQYPVPQFIEEEGKIVFFLTFRQFFLLVGGGAVCFLLFFTLPLTFAIIGSLFIMILVSAIAFIKINGLPIIKIVLNFLGFVTQNKNYTWKREDLPYLPKIQDIQKVQEIPIIKKGPSATQNISRLEDVKKRIETKR